jgi:hypothetical protein
MCDSFVAGDCAADFVVLCVPFQQVCVIPSLLVTVLLILCPLPGCMCDSLVADDCAADFVVFCVPFQLVCVIPLLLVTVLLILLCSVFPSRLYV